MQQENIKILSRQLCRVFQESISCHLSKLSEKVQKLRLTAYDGKKGKENSGDTGEREKKGQYYCYGNGDRDYDDYGGMEE